MPTYRLCRHRGKFAVSWVDERGERQRRSLGTTDRAEADRALEVFKREATRVTRPSQTIGEIWQAYRNQAAGRPIATTMGHEEKALKARFFHLQPDAINDEIVDAHIAERRGARISDGTLWTELGHLRIALAWAEKKGLIEKAPYVKRPAQPEPKRDYLTRDQFNKFLAVCEYPHLRRFAILAITTGARASAILDLTWDRVDFERGLVILKNPQDTRPMKGRAIVPMNATLRSALTEAKEGALSDFVIEWAGQKVGRVNKGVTAASDRSGLGFVTPHVMRHSAAVWMAEAGVDFEEIAQYLGHENSTITKRVYARFSPTHLRKAASVLDIEIPVKNHLTLIVNRAHNVQHGNQDDTATDQSDGGAKGSAASSGEG